MSDAAASERLSEPRIALVAPDDMNAEQRELMTDKQAQLSLFQLCARHPEVLRRLKATGSFANQVTVLPARSREIMILRMAWLLQSEFEWGQHHPIAIAAGLTADEIERTKAGPGDERGSEWDRAVLIAIDGLVSDCMIPTESWDVLRSEWSEEMMLELVIFFGHYIMVATFANTFGLGAPPGKPGFDG